MPPGCRSCITEPRPGRRRIPCRGPARRRVVLLTALLAGMRDDVHSGPTAVGPAGEGGGPMEYSLLGPTGGRVSEICLGTATFGVAPDAQEAQRVVHAALDLGINFVDTADVYGASPTSDRPGVPPAAGRQPAEQILGRALAGRRDGVLIATRSGKRRFDPAAGLSRRYIIQQVEHSLRRLGTDYIDLYYAHSPDPDTPLEQTLTAYDDLVRQGKLRYVALSNHPAWQVIHALWIADDRRLAAAPACTQVEHDVRYL